MKKGRIEAFSDGVLAIIITIMVLEIKVPHGSDLIDIQPLIPIFISYILSFVYIGIYWNNHHHMMHTVTRISGKILWANLHLLFWLSLIPFASGWIGENHFEAIPMALYGVVLLMCAIAYFILQTIILKVHSPDSILQKALDKDLKGKMSPPLYIAGIICSLYWPLLGGAFYVLVAFIWIIPDRRIEVIFNEEQEIDS